MPNLNADLTNILISNQLNCKGYFSAEFKALFEKFNQPLPKGLDTPSSHRKYLLNNYTPIPYEELNLIIKAYNGILKAVFEDIQNPFSIHISSYMSTHDSLANIFKDIPNLKEIVCQVMNLEIEVLPLESYSNPAPTSPVVIIARNKLMVFTNTNESLIKSIVDINSLFINCLYAIKGFGTQKYMLPIFKYRLKVFLDNYKTLSYLDRLSPNLYSNLIYCAYQYGFDSLKDFLLVEGFTIEELRFDTDLSTTPCTDGETVILTYPTWSDYLLMDKTSYGTLVNTQIDWSLVNNFSVLDYKPPILKSKNNSNDTPLMYIILSNSQVRPYNKNQNDLRYTNLVI